MNQKRLTYFVGVFENITEPKTLTRTGKKPVQAAKVTITTDDGQKAFFEVRDNILRAIEMLKIIPGQVVKIGFVFIGNEKGENTFNNLFINEIEIQK